MNENNEKQVTTKIQTNYLDNINYELLAAMEVDKKIYEIEDNYTNKANPANLANTKFAYQEKKEEFKLIPKYQNYMEYMIVLLQLLPRVEKFNLGNEYKRIMYDTFENIMYLDKIESKSRLYYLNKIDAGINIQRVYLRIMAKYKWISLEKFNIVMINILGEIGKIVGGLVKYYAKNNKKSV